MEISFSALSVTIKFLEDGSVGWLDGCLDKLSDKKVIIDS